MIFCPKKCSDRLYTSKFAVKRSGSSIVCPEKLRLLCSFDGVDGEFPIVGGRNIIVQFRNICEWIL